MDMEHYNDPRKQDWIGYTKLDRKVPASTRTPS